MSLCVCISESEKYAEMIMGLRFQTSIAFYNSWRVVVVHFGNLVSCEAFFFAFLVGLTYSSLRSTWPTWAGQIGYNPLLYVCVLLDSKDFAYRLVLPLSRTAPCPLPSKLSSSGGAGT